MRILLRTRTLISAMLCVSVLTAGCTTLIEEPFAPRTEEGRWYGDEIAYTSLRAVYLHSAQLGGNKDLSEHFAQWLVRTLHVYETALVKPGFVPQQDAERIWRQLRFMAVLQEKHPVEQWSADQRVLQLLARARSSDLDDVATLRKQNWSQSFLGRGLRRD